MAKYKRMTIGSVVKSKEKGEADYIQIRKDLKQNLVLKPGQTLKLESAASQLKSLKEAVSAGKLSEDLGETIEERISKIPEWVRFEIVLVEKSND
jgi:hypothetical protein